MMMQKNGRAGGKGPQGFCALRLTLLAPNAWSERTSAIALWEPSPTSTAPVSCGVSTTGPH